MWNKQRILLTITEPCSNPEIPQEQLKNYHVRKIFESLRGPTIWRVMPRNVWNDIVSWQTGRLNNSTKYQFHALMTIISKKKNWNPWENCQKYALKLSWNACTWHVLEDLIFYSHWSNLQDRSQNGPNPWTQDWAWTVSPHLIYGIWSSQFLETRIRVIKNGETRTRT